MSNFQRSPTRFDQRRGAPKAPAPVDLEKEQERSDRLRGVVLQVHAVQWDVLVSSEVIRCVVKRTLKDREGLPVVGDEVLLEPPMTGMSRIVAILPRRQVLLRPDVHQGRAAQVLAANLDQVLITASVAQPALNPGLVDRYLLAAWKLGIQPLLAITKLDLPTDEDTDALLQDLEALKVPILRTSVPNREGLETLLDVLEGHTTAMVGLSGVGKTSLARVLLKDPSLEIGEVSASTGKGRHTTSSARLLPLPDGRAGFLIDMPGQRVFGLTELTQADLLRGFPELADAPSCQYPECRHAEEAGCAVRAALEEGSLSERRYQALCRLSESLRE
ncbi:MAG: ribosome small subunit-dependent GTPase A [Myxococcota bacterium]